MRIRRGFMDKKIAGLLGAVAAVGALGTAQASAAPAPSDVLKANSYADLLEPIPNAAKVLQALDEQAPPETEPKVQLAQWYHHHHHRSEEHTSELQSHLNLVCRLLLEKKKETPARPTPSTTTTAPTYNKTASPATAPQKRKQHTTYTPATQ